MASEATRVSPANGAPRKSWLADWWPVLLWAAVISIFSTSAFTDSNTGRFIIPVLHWFLPGAPMQTLMRIHHYIRKCAHFTEYFIFSLLILRAIRHGRSDARLAWALLAIAIVAGYAALDEFHQSFVPGRTPAVGDVLIDTSGGTAAQIVAGLVLLWGQVRHKRRVASGE
jgi:VanZ family protein